MICKYPYVKEPSGKWKLLANINKEHRDGLTPFPCGSCVCCRINKCLEKTGRLLLEARSHKNNCFLTLTYDCEKIDCKYIKKCNPRKNICKLSLRPDHLTKFIKRFRRKIEPHKIRYFAVGEYGSERFRPHYHIALFGYDIACTQKLLTGCTTPTNPQTCSKFNKENLCEARLVWNYGSVDFGELNSHSARYITGYIAKKLYYGKNVDKRAYEILDGRHMEFSRSSKMNGGLGIKYIEKIAQDIKKKKYSKNIDLEVIRRLKIGSKNYPLGRYLTKKLCDLLGLNEKYEKEVKKYQLELINSFTGDEFYYNNIIENLRGAVKSKEKRSELYKKRRSYG